MSEFTCPENDVTCSSATAEIEALDAELDRQISESEEEIAALRLELEHRISESESRMAVIEAINAQHAAERQRWAEERAALRAGLVEAQQALDDSGDDDLWGSSVLRSRSKRYAAAAAEVLARYPEK